MGKIGLVMGELRGVGCDDASILKVVNPPLGDRNRPVNDTNVAMPPHEAWRFLNPIGKRLDKAKHIIISNHFKINTSLIPRAVYHYDVRILRQKDGEWSSDITAVEDKRTTVAILKSAHKVHPNWTPEGCGIAYDGRSALYSSAALLLPGVDGSGKPFVTEDVAIIDEGTGKESKTRFRVSVTLVAKMCTPGDSLAEWQSADAGVLRALNVALLSRSRWESTKDSPEWYLCGAKIFQASGRAVELAPGFVALRGFNAGLKICMAGLVCVADLTVGVFLQGGSLLDIMWKVCGFRSLNDMVDASKKGGFTRQRIDGLTAVVKSVRCKVTHLGHTKKIKGLGPAANSPESEFEQDGVKMTVDKYFALMCNSTDPSKAAYKIALPKGGLLYPSLPCLNVGTNTRPILMPAELIFIRSGQIRSNLAPDMTAALIKEAAVKPAERFAQLLNGGNGDGNNIISVLQREPGFGMCGISNQPIQMQGILLPPAKIKYAGATAIVEPGLEGLWFQSDKHKFVTAPPAPVLNVGYRYAVVLVHGPGGRTDQQTIPEITEFFKKFEKDSLDFGVKLTVGGGVLEVNDTLNDLDRVLRMLKEKGARIGFMIMTSPGGESYGRIKLAADLIGLPTQCLRKARVSAPPKGYHTNVMLKVNTKLGGTNHTLISRLPPNTPKPTTFQDPPASLSWIFDKPCMLVGIDVSHPDHGRAEGESLAAVVGSVNRSCSQYVAHIRSQAAGVEIVATLTEAMFNLFNSFKKKNGVMPAHVLIYRDGVGDTQFDEVLSAELPQVQEAVKRMGCTLDEVKISIVVCQKRHSTRLVYRAAGSSDIVNLCPGIVADATLGEDSIASANHNEFYLTSHVSIQGTAKACKYSLIYDKIGMRLSELELLTYWTCYLYCRCNRSVSLATPAYYAHWASKRARILFRSGATAKNLIDISDAWSATDAKSSMFFV